MSVKTSLTDSVTPSPNVLGDAVVLSELFAALEAVLPETESGDGLEDINALARIIGQLTTKAPAPDVKSPHTDTQSLDLGALVSRHLQTRHQSLAPALKVRLLFWQTLFAALEEQSPLDEQLNRELERLRAPFLMAALRDESLATDSQQDFRRFINQLMGHGVYWYPQSGKEGGAFQESLVQAIDVIVDASLNEQPAALQAAIEDFITQADKQLVRAQMMEQRCSESELGMAKIHRAQAQVIALLETLNGCAMPESVLEFTRTTLKGELQFILINQSEAAPAWQSWSAIIQRLPQVFPPLIADQERPVEPEPPNRQQLYRDVQVIVGLLDEHVTVSAANQQPYDEGVEDLRERLFEKLRGISVPLNEFTELSIPDELSRLGAAVSPSLLKKVAGLKAGDWFLFANNDNQLLRCKLLLRPPEVEHLLFVNRSGHRVLQKSVQDFSACLATRIALPLVQQNPFDKALAVTVEKLQMLVDKNRVLVKKAKAKSPPVEAQLATTETETEIATATEVAAAPAADPTFVAPEPLPKPASDRKSAAQKALQEARVLAKLEIRRERQAAHPPPTDAVGEVDTQLGEEAMRERVTKLNIGAWLELPQTEGADLQRCKLVAIMRASDTYIFTNRRGVKVAEYDLSSLTALLLNSAARIVSNGDDFEGQLSKVVLTLRRDT